MLTRAGAIGTAVYKKIVLEDFSKCAIALKSKGIQCSIVGYRPARNMN